jgi:hypothetical protein
MAWSGEHRAFVVEELIQNGGSPITMQLAFRVRFSAFPVLFSHNPRELHQRPLHSPSVTVWCASFEFGMWDPYFLEEDEITLTVTSDRYCAMLENFLRPKLNYLYNDNGADGATAYTSRRSLGILREIFPGHVVSFLGDIGWPPRSPDLTPCDFFLWSYLKSQVYQHRPQTLEGL